MNNQEAINSLKNIIEYWSCRPTEVEAAKLAITALEAQQADIWIPISSGKLPDKEGDYLVYDENKQITIEYFYKSKDTGWSNPYFTTDYDVIAWKPIAPYKEEQV
jgi:hypothetical protein